MWTQAHPLGEGLVMLLQVLVCPRKAVTQPHIGLKFMLKDAIKPRLAAFNRYLYSYASEQGSSMVHARSFVPTEGMPPVPNAFQEGELFLPTLLL